MIRWVVSRRLVRRHSVGVHARSLSVERKSPNPNKTEKTRGAQPASDGKKFVSFFEELDNTDSKKSIKSIFAALGDPPPPTRKTTMPAAKPHVEKTMSPLGGRSIFDAFPVPEAPPPIDPNAYDKEAYTQYRELIDEVVSGERYQRQHTKKALTEEFLAPIRSWLQADATKLEYNLPLLQSSVQKGLNSDLTSDESRETMKSFREELKQQREKFLAVHEWTDRQYEHAQIGLLLLGNLCAKRARALPLEVAWEKLKEAGMCLDKTSLTSYLYACTVFSGRRRLGSLAPLSRDSILDMLSSTATPLQSDCPSQEKLDGTDPGQVVDLPEEIATFHDLLYEPTEQSVTVRVKALVARRDAAGAEALVDRFLPKQEAARQRTYLPILRCYLEEGDIASGLRVFKEMRDTPTVILEPETYVQLLAAIADRGFFSSDSTPIEGATELGYSPAHGPKLFDQLVGEMADDILEITSASARRLYSVFESAYRGKEMTKNLVRMHPLAPVSPDNKPAEDGEFIASRVMVAADTGVCPRSGAALRLINLSPNERKRMLDSLLKLAAATEKEFRAGTEFQGNADHAVVELRRFADWLDARDGEPFTAVVDGANIAYYMQNFDQGKFNVYQIDFMVKSLEEIGEKPLVILPYKYGLPYFTTNASRRRQRLSKEESFILNRLANAGKLYRVPQGCLDDYYWMLASISDQTISRGSTNIEVPTDEPSGRWPGTRPVLISNDQMRDHKLELLEPRLFRRWYSCHIVNYNFTAFVDNECVDSEISFAPADSFSREIQGNPAVDADGTSGGTAWHFPVSDWDMHERFCVRLPPATK